MATWSDCTGAFGLGGFAACLGDWIGEWPQGYPVVLDGLQVGDELDFWIALENPAHPGDPFYLADGSYGTPVWVTYTSVRTPENDNEANQFGTGGAASPPPGEPPSPAGDWKLWVVAYRYDSDGNLTAPPFPPEHYVPHDYAAAGTAGPNPWHWSAWQPRYTVDVKTYGAFGGRSWAPTRQIDFGLSFNSSLDGEALWDDLLVEDTFDLPGDGPVSGGMFAWDGSNYVPGPLPPSGWSAALTCYQSSLAFQLPSPPPPTMPAGMSTSNAPFHSYVPDWQPGMTQPPPSRSMWWQWEGPSPVGVDGVQDYEWTGVPVQLTGFDSSNQELPHGFDHEPTALFEAWCFDDTLDPTERAIESGSHVGPDGQQPVMSVLVSQSDRVGFPEGDGVDEPQLGNLHGALLTGFGLAPTFMITAGVHESFTGVFPSNAMPGISLPGGEDSWGISFQFSDFPEDESVGYVTILASRWRYWVGPQLRSVGGPFWTPGDVQVKGKPAGPWIKVERQAEPIGEILAPPP
jgi:hypothetical protein